mmetsp:Transcript_38584/g.80865  ORF Transcript_38584/g.80865 Transcript_38584/m.80865 type:complete len:244 (-) Transcript_38584:805-1536(-)
MQQLRMAFIYEIVVFPSYKHGRYETAIGVTYRRNVTDAEPRLTLDRALNHAKRHRHHKVGNVDALFLPPFHHLLRESRQVREGRVQNHAADRGVPTAVHNRRCGSHRSPPEAYCGNVPGRSEVMNDGLQIFPFVESQTNEFSLRFSRPGKVEGDHGNAEAEQVTQLRDDFDSAGGITVEVDDDRVTTALPRLDRPLIVSVRRCFGVLISEILHCWEFLLVFIATVVLNHFVNFLQPSVFTVMQ